MIATWFTSFSPCSEHCWGVGVKHLTTTQAVLLTLFFGLHHLSFGFYHIEGSQQDQICWRVSPLQGTCSRMHYQLFPFYQEFFSNGCQEGPYFFSVYLDHHQEYFDAAQEYSLWPNQYRPLTRGHYSTCTWCSLLISAVLIQMMNEVYSLLPQRQLHLILRLCFFAGSCSISRVQLFGITNLYVLCPFMLLFYTCFSFQRMLLAPPFLLTYK